MAGGEPLELAVTALTPPVASARVQWELCRDDGRAIYAFGGIYTLAQIGGSWRIAAIAHDELAKLRAALGPDQKEASRGGAE